MAPLFILTETSAGYVLLKATDKKLLKDGDIAKKTSNAQDTCNLLKLKQFKKFESATVALNEAAAVGEGQVTPLLSSLLDSIKDEKKASLAVADPKLGNAIAKIPNLSLQPIADSSTADLFRAIREHLPSLIPGLRPDDLSTMSLGLSHSLSRHKLKFSADKVDTMIIQAISLLDDIDKELNQYAMRVKEWFGWHFPEMARIINDNLAYSRVIMKMGMRSNAVDTDLNEILPEEIAKAVKNAAEVSMGTEISTEDLENIQALADQVISFSEFRTQLSSYLSNRMQAIAPNLTALVGELVGARLIAHAGSLSNLAKSPASTIQILGAEKALFRALKTKHDTPKYGLIYHASLIGQATGKNKGKIARVLAAKAALGLRVDSLGSGGADQERDGPEPTEEERAAIGNRARRYVEHKVRVLEGRSTVPRNAGIGPTGGLVSEQGKWEIKEARKYNPQADGLSGNAEAAVQLTNGHAVAPGPDVADSESGSDSDSEDESAVANPLSGGLSEKDAKKQRKAEKAARKAARAEKRALKAQKKAKKEAKKAANAESEAAGDGKKRKRDDDTEEKGEKKKKKKQSKS